MADPVRMSPVSPEEIARGERESQQRGGLGRRRFLQGALGLIVARGVDEILTEVLYPNSAASIESIGPPQQERWGVFGGLGQQDGARIGRTLAQGAMKDMRLECVKYPDNNFDISIIARAFAPVVYETYEQGGVLSAICSSMGLLTFFRVMRELVHRPDMRGRIPQLGRLVCLSSPFDVGDAVDGSAVRLIEALPYEGSISGKTMIETMRRMREHPEDVIKNIAEGVKATTQGPPPKMWAGQAVLTAETTLPEYKQDFRDFITSRSCGLYVMPQDANADRVVYDEQAFYKIYDYWGWFGASLEPFLLQNAGHADVQQASQQIGPWLDRTQPSLRVN